MANMDPIAEDAAYLIRTKENRRVQLPFARLKLLNEATHVWNQHHGPKPDYKGLHLRKADGSQLWHLYQGDADQGLADGIYCYVTVPDGTIRAALRQGGLHHELSGRCLHVLFAGEAEFKKGVLGRWNNNSGTYQSLATLKFQAGFGIAAGFTEDALV